MGRERGIDADRFRPLGARPIVAVAVGGRFVPVPVALGAARVARRVWGARRASGGLRCAQCVLPCLLGFLRDARCDPRGVLGRRASTRVEIERAQRWGRGEG